MLATLISALSLFGGHADADVAVLRPAGWTVEVRRDRFTGKVDCTVSKKRVTAAQGWVTVHLGRRVDTDDADVRVDDGPSRKARQIRRPLLDPNRKAKTALGNPSGGRVILPQAELTGARSVWVRPDPRSRIAHFDVRGLDAALQAAADAACPGAQPAS